MFADSPFWYLTRSTAVVAFVLMTLTTVLGLLAGQRQLASRGWPRFATQQLHRNASLLAVVFLAVHVVTTVLDSYVDVSWWALVVPLTSAYDTMRVALGTIALDVLVLLVVSSLVRDRLPERVWRGIHWSAYGLWPLAAVHFVTEGTDAGWSGWGTWLAAVCGAAVLAAGVARWTVGRRAAVGPVRSLQAVAR